MKIKVQSSLMAILILGVIFGSVAITSAVGYWKTTTDKVPAKYTTGDAAGEYNPMDIKGSYDFATISDVFDIPLAELGQAFLVADGPSVGAFQVKTLEETWGAINTDEREVGTDSVRLFVAFYKGLPIEMTDTTGLPGSAVDILLAKGNPTDDQLAFMKTHRVDALLAAEGTEPAEASASAEVESSDESSPSAESEESERKIKGTTTWKEVVDWGVPQADLETIAGGAIKSLSSLIKDDCAARGLEFSSIKSELQGLVDAIPVK